MAYLNMALLHFVTNFLLSLKVKDFENRLILGEDMGKCLMSCFFFDSRCSKRKHDVRPPETCLNMQASVHRHKIHVSFC